MSEHENFWRRVSDDPRKVHSPLALLAVPQYGRDDAEPREPLVRVFHAFVLVRAVAIVASVLGPVYRRAVATARGTYWSCRLFFLYAFEISDVEAVEGMSSHE